MKKTKPLARKVAFLAVSAITAMLLAGPTAALAEPDEEVLGKSRGYPVASDRLQANQMPFRVGSWSALDRVPGMLVSRVARAETPSPLPRAAAEPAIRYRHRNLGYTLDDYLERQRITGLLIVKDGQIVVERYRYGRTEEARFLSFSMAKSVTSLLVGAAQARGVIASLDDPAQKYETALAGSPYGQTSIRDLLRMSSGLSFTERYDGNDDIARLSRSVRSGQPPVTEMLRSITDRHSAPGQKFVYASAETEVLGRVLAGATGRSVAALTREWLWQPLGAERDAFWCTDTQGQESAYFCFNAALRDWGRLGWMLARDGRVGEREIVPRDYVLDATDARRQPPAFQPYRATSFFGYGYQFWLHPSAERTFVMQGVHGQSLLVQPASGIVIVQTAVYAGANGVQDPDAYAERSSFWTGVLQSLGGSTRRW
jgi:CubicO group peptidase (beta-lactamase class C family)